MSQSTQKNKYVPDVMGRKDVVDPPHGEERVEIRVENGLFLEERVNVVDDLISEQLLLHHLINIHNDIGSETFWYQTAIKYHTDQVPNLASEDR